MLAAIPFPRAAAMALGVLSSAAVFAQTSGTLSSGGATAPGTTRGLSPAPDSLLGPRPGFGTTTPLAPLPGSPSPGLSTPSPSFSTPSPSFSTPSPSFSTPSPSFSSNPSSSFGTPAPSSSGARPCPNGLTFC